MRHHTTKAWRISSRTLAVLGAVALLAAGCGSGAEPAADTGAADEAAPAETTAVTFVEGLDVFPYEVVSVAIEEGFLAEEGIEAEIVHTENEIQAIAAGSAQFAVGGTMAILQAHAEGVDAITIFATMDGLGMNTAYSNALTEEAGLTPDSPLEERLRALEGETIGLTGPLGDDEVFFRYYLSLVGLDPDTDVEFAYIGGTPDRIAAMDAGSIAAYMSSIPAAELAEFNEVGVRMIVPTQEDLGLEGIPYTGVHTTQSYADDNPEVVAAAGRALSSAANFMVAEPEATIEIVESLYPETDPSVVRSGMEAIFPAIPENGRMTEEGWVTLIEAGTAAGVIEAEIDTAEGVVWTNEYLLD